MDDLKKLLVRKYNFLRLNDPLLFKKFNPAQKRLINMVNAKDLLIGVATMGNGTGKTYALTAIPAAIMWPTQNPIFNLPIFKNWPYPKRLRFISTAKNLADSGPIQRGFRELFPIGRYRQTKGMGRGYYAEGASDTGFTWDCMTYNQTREEFAGETIGANFYSEPPPYEIFVEGLARTRMGGIHIIEMTPLELAAYVKDDYIDPCEVLDSITKKSVGKVYWVQGTIEENCIEHAAGGQLPHVAIERTVASYPEEEREARASGGFQHLAGLVLKNYSIEHNEAECIEDISDYHAECWEKGMWSLYNILDPHDRKPWALGWYAVFPNDDVVTIAEYPDYEFHKVNTGIETLEDYRHIIINTEKGLGRAADRRLGDPLFIKQKKLGTEGVFQQMRGSCLKCEESKIDCSHKLIFLSPPNSIPEGHTLIRLAIGNVKEGKNPKFWNLKHCVNHRFACTHYAYGKDKNRETQGPNEQPQLIHKDFIDLFRYGYLFGFRYIEKIVRPHVIYRKLEGRGSYRGA